MNTILLPVGTVHLEFKSRKTSKITIQKRQIHPKIYVYIKLPLLTNHE
jgi:hypothetical protein